MKYKLFLVIILLVINVSSSELFSGEVNSSADTIELDETFITNFTILNQTKPLFVEISKNNQSFEEFNKVRSYKIKLNSSNKTEVKFDMGIDHFKKWDSWERLSSQGDMGAFSGEMLEQESFGLKYFPDKENKSAYIISTFILTENNTDIYFIANKNLKDKIKLVENIKTGYCTNSLKPKDNFRVVDSCFETEENKKDGKKFVLFWFILLNLAIFTFIFIKKKKLKLKTNLNYKKTIIININKLIKINKLKVSITVFLILISFLFIFSTDLKDNTPEQAVKTYFNKITPPIKDYNSAYSMLSIEVRHHGDLEEFKTIMKNYERSLIPETEYKILNTEITDLDEDYAAVNVTTKIENHKTDIIWSREIDLYKENNEWKLIQRYHPAMVK